MTIGLAGLVVSSCADDANGRDAHQSRDMASPVEVVKIERGPIATYEAASGRIEAIHRAPVFARVSEICKEVRVIEGQRIKVNDTLALLEDAEYRYQRDRELATREKARQGTQDAQVQRDKAHADHDRIKRLIEQSGEGIYSKNDLADAKLALDKAEIALKVAGEELKRTEATCAEAELRFQNTVIRSPIAGVVVQVDVELFDLVKVDQKLFDIAELDALEIEVSVPESSAGSIRAVPASTSGAPDISHAQAALLYVAAWPSARFLGYVDTVAPIVDRERGMVDVKLRVIQPEALVATQERYEALLAQFPPPERRVIEASAQEFATNENGMLRPGMWVNASIVKDVKPDTLLIPSGCVVNGAIYVVVKIVQAPGEGAAPQKPNGQTSGVQK
ncbi:MAG: efflux RND transporter periplasmic adaptor subunit [Planctomycetes bacterium]|nr:efflux RND transporter periplasmic adaptor subunit [Planctomycetota bacterium]